MDAVPQIHRSIFIIGDKILCKIQFSLDSAKLQKQFGQRQVKLEKALFLFQQDRRYIVYVILEKGEFL